jgi:elongation factor Ts
MSNVISAAAISELRNLTGAGMMDCKKALTETNGNMDEAVDWLRKKGIASAAKKADRVATEGLVVTVSNGTQAIALEVNCETDFVAKNEDFQKLCLAIAEQALANKTVDIEVIKTLTVNGKAAQDALTELVAKIGENMSLRRADILEVSNGSVATYIHNAVVDNAGKIGVLVALESDSKETERLNQLGRQIAMHIAAAKPEALSRDDVDQANLEREKSVLVDQARASGKPDSIIEKMVEGRINKYFEEICLLEQIFVLDGENKVATVVENLAKELGTPVTLKAFTRFTLGEGIEKKQNDFAAEVAAAAGVA